MIHQRQMGVVTTHRTEVELGAPSVAGADVAVPVCLVIRNLFLTGIALPPVGHGIIIPL
jgi:hypothetical protein